MIFVFLQALVTTFKKADSELIELQYATAQELCNI